MKELAYLNKYFLKYKFRLLLGFIFVTMSNIFAIVPAQLVRHSFDLVTTTLEKLSLSEDTLLREDFAQTILLYGLLIVAMAFIRGAFLFLMRQTIIVMSRYIEYDLKNEIYTHYQSLPLSFYRKNNTGDLMARVSEDVSRVRMYAGPAIMYSINMAVTFIVVISYMVTVNAKLTFFSLLPLPVLSISIYYVSSIINKRSEAIQQGLSQLSTFTQEAFSGIRVIKAFAREADSLKNFAKESNSYKDKSLRLALVNALFFPLMMGLIGMSAILTVYVGGLEVMAGNITAGNIAEFLIYVNMLTWPVATLGWVASMIQRAAASQKRINEFLNTKTDIVSQKDLEKKIDGNIKFKNVTFTYPDSGITALENISFEIKQGETLAILGTTGSGKSTIANLMCRMYDVSEGQILVDNTPVQDYSLASLRGQIGYVPQDIFLFSDTVRDNISFGSNDVTEEDILGASKNADLHENIASFSDGLDTMVGERGVTLSGGQKQRVSIARAIIRKPQILILDDCLSAVDTKTENAILNNLKTIMHNRTSVVISHRVSSVKLAQKIIVIDEGKIVESGTHQSLIKIEGGTYKELYEKQLKSEDEVAAV